MASGNAEDEFETVDYGMTPTVFQRVQYYVLALLPMVIPILMYVRIFGMNVTGSVVTLALGILASAGVLSAAYHNITYTKRVQLMRKSEEPTKSAFGKGNVKDYENAVSSYHDQVKRTAIFYSVFYNNLLFILVAIVSGSYFLKGKIGLEMEFIMSNLLGSGFAFWNSLNALKLLE
uniref:Translocon-associated protein subunit gamma n=1 Tax=Compsopogon caeruleus TaxID=31354 RepID=A0A7S1TJ44_9RHOD|mmetsp:Transcript_8679/g.17607  ORF Transcript_8679/g.17607 Transcript_8679/m.17607 type:complete len:176 (+) Transcript_8679:103-630(+)|eukprot:CAMPEP_0184680936 /NCGR_PEP_ID=MMETSP0312-20130426/3860_1 /TAXON_ID=31354 /ORGANISM="Compsopogon coeruleus, Strain SAG 36.94" /LENGTH=175 /DNA_ID=CAMNT_0027131401 /DNA_START=69 /DNA_END=596 /DNA_ORIENTATION=-